MKVWNSPQASACDTHLGPQGKIAWLTTQSSKGYVTTMTKRRIVLAEGAIRPMQTGLSKYSDTARYAAPRARHSASAAARLSLKLPRE